MRKYPWLIGLILLAGCGSNLNDAYGGTAPAPVANVAPVAGTNNTGFKIIEPNGAPERDGSTVDSLQLTALDATGAKLSEEQLPFAREMDFQALPPNATAVQVDYLRNGSVALFQARETLQPGQAVLQDPQEKPVQERTRFHVNREGSGFKLQLSKTDKNGATETTDDFKIKGVCYAPTPINLVGNFAPNIGDWFFDDIPQKDNPSAVGFYNWKLLWAKIANLGDGFGASRDDLGRMRAMGANTIRVYSMLSRQQNESEPKFPDPRTKQHLSHHEFLAKCWNGGKDPLYVIVGIPMPEECVYPLPTPAPGASPSQSGPEAKKAFYDFVVNETINDLKDEPAVLGFTLLNEINNGEYAYPGRVADNNTTGVVNEKSDYYWGKLKAYTDAGKAIAPDKLFGIAFHDFREIAQYSSAFPQTGETYLQQLKNLDFVGVNTYAGKDYDHQFKYGWGAVQGDQAKPIIFTELGFPATSRTGDDPATINPVDPQAWQNVRERLALMIPQAYDAGRRSLGLCYFEFSDEWWKQPEDYVEVPHEDGVNTKRVPRADRQYGGSRESGFPNGWWDEEGFGLFAVERGKDPRTGMKLPNNFNPLVNVDGHDIGPYRAYDRLIPRTPIIDELTRQFQSR